MNYQLNVLPKSKLNFQAEFILKHIGIFFDMKCFLYRTELDKLQELTTSDLRNKDELEEFIKYLQYIFEEKRYKILIESSSHCSSLALFPFDVSLGQYSVYILKSDSVEEFNRFIKNRVSETNNMAIVNHYITEFIKLNPSKVILLTAENY